ncbi:MAG: two-component system activity regulator YycH [Sporolactobacillus sp.]
MNREVFKSLLLSVLVLSSIAMTWNILFYKSSFENYKSPSAAAKPVAIAKFRSASSVVRPSLVLEHSTSGTLGMTQGNAIQKMYSLLQQASFSNVVPIASRAQIPARRGQTSYEVIFPAPLMHDTLKKFFQFNERGDLLPDKALIDRIEFYPSANGGQVALFSSQSGQNQFYAEVSKLNFDALRSDFRKADTVSYGRQRLKGKIVYLPTGKTKIRSVMFYYHVEKIEDFIPILFNDPENNVFHSRGKLTYTDGTSQLEQTGNVLQYVNVNPGISKSSQQITDPIYHSYELLNNYKEWTNDFSYAGLSLSAHRKSETVIFRMRIGDYLAFNTDYYPNPYLTQIELNWKNGQLSSFNRTLLDLNPIDQPGSTTLDSGKEVIERLRAYSVPVNRIQDLVIGYQLNAPKSENDYSLEAMPGWFYELNNHWYSVSKVTAPQQQERGDTSP